MVEGPRAPDDGAVRPAGAGRRRRAARAELRAAHGAMITAHPEAYPKDARLPDRRGAAARPDHLARAHGAARAAGGVGAGLHHRVLERREPDPRALGAPRGRAGDPRGARRRARRACGGRCWPRAWCSAAPAPCSACSSRGRWWPCSRATPRASRCGRSNSRWTRPCCGSASALALAPRCCSRSCRACRRRTPPTASGCRAAACAITSGTNRRLRAVRRDADRGVVRAARRRRHAAHDADRAAARRRPASTRATCWPCNVPVDLRSAHAGPGRSAFYKEVIAPDRAAAGRRARGGRHRRAVARGGRVWPGLPVLGGGLQQGRRRRGSARPQFRTVSPGFFARARRAHHRRPRLQRRRPPRRREGGHRQPERGAADVPERSDAREPPLHVDRSGDGVHRRQHRAAPHRRRGRGRRRRERGAGRRR